MDAAGILGQVILHLFHLRDQLLQVGGEGVGEAAVQKIAAGGMEHGDGVQQGIGEAGIARAVPAALPEKHIHQEAGADIGADAGEVAVQRRPGGIVCPDQVVGGVVVIEGGICIGGDVDAQSLIGDALFPQPGLVISEEDQDHRLLPGAEGIGHGGHLPCRVPDTEEVVVDDVVVAVAELPLGDEGLVKAGGIGAVGAMVLVGHIEGKDRGGGHGGQGVLRDVGQEDFVARDAGDEIPEVVLDEAVAGNSQVFVDIQPVVEGLIARVGTLDGVALLREVPGVAPGGAAEALQPGEARQHTALRVDGAAGEDIGEQTAVEALVQQGVVRGVGVGACDPVGQPGQVAEGLQLGHDDADPLILRDVIGGKAAEDGFGGLLVIALRG